MLVVLGAIAWSPSATARGVLLDAATIAELDRYWPYRVALRRAQTGPRGEIRAGSVGVLIRVEAQQARIDFGRDGLTTVAVDETDLVERARRVRDGRDIKMAPNFALAIGTKLVDSSEPVLRPLGLEAARRADVFLCVFADARGPAFARYAREFRRIHDRPRVATLLFPQGDAGDPEIRTRLRALDAALPFVFSHLSAPYTRSLVGRDPPPLRFLLQSAEGRVLLGGVWGGESAAHVEQILTARRSSPSLHENDTAAH